MKKYVILIFALLLSNAASGVGVSGIDISTRPDKQGYYSVTIEGSNFGLGPDIVLFDDFNNHESNKVAELDSPLIGSWDSYGVWAGRPKVVDYGDERLVKVRDYTYPSSSGNRMAQLEKRFERTSQIFFSFSVMLPEGNHFSGSNQLRTFPSESSWKFSWLMDGPDSTGNDGLFDICIPTHTGNGRFALAGNDGTLGGVPSDKAWSWTKKNHMSFGLIKKEGSDTEGHLLFQHAGTAGKGFRDERKDQTVMLPDATKSFDRVRFPGWWGNGDLENFNALYDDFYIAVGPNALARVELTDHSSVKNAAVRLPMPVVSWQPEEITIKVHKKYIEGGDRYYVEVFNAENRSDLYEKHLYCSLCPMM